MGTAFSLPQSLLLFRGVVFVMCITYSEFNPRSSVTMEVSKKKVILLDRRYRRIILR